MMTMTLSKNAQGQFMNSLHNFKQSNMHLTHGRLNEIARDPTQIPWRLLEVFRERKHKNKPYAQ